MLGGLRNRLVREARHIWRHRLRSEHGRRSLSLRGRDRTRSGSRTDGWGRRCRSAVCRSGLICQRSHAIGAGKGSRRRGGRQCRKDRRRRPLQDDTLGRRHAQRCSNVRRNRTREHVGPRLWHFLGLVRAPAMQRSASVCVHPYECLQPNTRTRPTKSIIVPLSKVSAV